MPEQRDTDLTLPSYVASLSGRYAIRPLVCTVVFHPRTGRIGERLVLPTRLAGGPLVIRRNGPGFSRTGSEDSNPIGDRHVSRRALVLSFRGEKLLLERPAEASRARVAGRELNGAIELDHEQLSRGVPIMLAHSVILLLRFDQSTANPGVPYGGDLGLRGGSNYLANLRTEILRAANSGDDVLIRGETGSGKEVVARAIHASGARAGKPLVAVNMAAIPTELAAPALFGNARGAFTGAERASDGYFLEADGGTLFLDEVGDTPQAVQPQLLRALQEREIQPVGGRMRTVSLQVISATDAPLDSEDCDFRAALRHRLGSLEIRLLPLREHPEDIGELAVHFLVAESASLQRGGVLPGEHSSQMEIARWAELFHQLLRYQWPGNVRELANACRQVSVESDAGIAVPERIRSAVAMARRDGGQDGRSAAGRSMREVGDSEFERAWEQSGYEPAGTARLLGVSRQSVYRRIDGSDRYRLASQVGPGELRRVLDECEGDCSLAARRLRVSLSALRAVLRGAGPDRH